MEIGSKITIKDNLFNQQKTGIVTQIEICYFKIITLDNITITYHWNDDIIIIE